MIFLNKGQFVILLLFFCVSVYFLLVVLCLQCDYIVLVYFMFHVFVFCIKLFTYLLDCQ